MVNLSPINPQDEAAHDPRGLQWQMWRGLGGFISASGQNGSLSCYRLLSTPDIIFCRSGVTSSLAKLFSPAPTQSFQLLPPLGLHACLSEVTQSSGLKLRSELRINQEERGDMEKQVGWEVSRKPGAL